MLKHLVPIWKCELCGEEYATPGDTLHSLPPLSNLPLSYSPLIKEYYEYYGQKMNLHVCENGDFGKSPFVGFKAVDSANLNRIEQGKVADVSLIDVLEQTCREMCDDLRVTYDEEHGSGYTKRDTLCKHLGEIKRILMCIDERRTKKDGG